MHSKLVLCNFLIVAILGNCFICLGRKEVVDCWPVKNTGCEDHDIELWLFVILIVQFDLMIQINHWIVSWPKVWCWFFSWMRSLLTCCKFNLLWLSAMLVDDPNYLYILDEWWFLLWLIWLSENLIDGVCFFSHCYCYFLFVMIFF